MIGLAITMMLVGMAVSFAGLILDNAYYKGKRIPFVGSFVRIVGSLISDFGFVVILFLLLM